MKKLSKLSKKERLAIKAVIYVIIFFVILLVLWDFLIGEPFMESMKGLF